MKHDPNVTGKSAAATIAVIYLVCVAAVVLLPDLSLTIAQSWVHGLDLSKIYALNVTFGSFILGLVTSTAGGWLVGYVFASVYNYFLKSK